MPGFFYYFFVRQILPKIKPNKKTRLKLLYKTKNRKARKDLVCTRVTNAVLKFQIENRKIERCIAVNTFFLVWNTVFGHIS